jgi:hypothetical protein
VIERELTRLLPERGVPTGLERRSAPARLVGGAFEVDAGAQLEAIGLEVAQAIHGELGR